MKKQPEKTEQTRQNLIQAFCQLYACKPIEKIRIQEITDLAGCNRGTFYVYFPDIYGIREDVETDLIQLAQNIRKNSGDSFLAPDIDALRQFWKMRETSLRAVLSEAGCDHFRAQVKASLNASPDSRSNEELALYLAEFRFSASLSLFQTWLKTGETLPADELLQLIYTLCTQGLNSIASDSS